MSAVELAYFADDLENVSEHRTLVIGDLTRWQGLGRDTASFSYFAFCSFDALDLDMMHSFAPEIILSPVIGDTFDVISVAEKLKEMGFQGRYRAISFDMPDNDVIRAEVGRAAPDLDFDILRMQEMPKAPPSDRT